MSAHHLPDTGLPLLTGSVGDALRTTAACFPDRRALAWAEGENGGTGSMTYAALLAGAERVACWLLSRGAPGDRVAIWSRNSVDWVLAEYGCALAGMIVASWNPGWTDFECRHAYDLTTPVVVLAGHDTRGTALFDRAYGIAPDRLFALEQLRTLAENAQPVPLPAVASADVFLIQFTSGTTGRAKGAAISQRAALNAAWLRFHAIGTDETDVIVNPSPLNHMGGAITMLLGCGITGACYTVMPRFDAGEMLRLMHLLGATRIGGVPTMLLALLEHPDWMPGSLQLRSVGAGGAQVPQPLVERLTRAFGCPVLVSYAQSECPMITSSVPGDPARLLAQTVGRVSPHVELKVIDITDGRTVARGETGAICVRGPMVMQGYHRMPDATTATIDADGFLHTGDLGSLDTGGYVRIQGRARDVVIRGGENIYPAEVEDALLAHPDVVTVAVVGVPDAHWGQQVGAAVIPRRGAGVTAQLLETHAAKRLAHFKVPRLWKFVDAFPMTASAKIRKVEVEAWFQDDAGNQLEGKGQ